MATEESQAEKSVLERLDSLVGLDAIKQLVHRNVALLKVRQAQVKAGLLDPQTEIPSLHMVFAGNPGTGKTTVARLMGELYREIGALRRGHLVEARSADLVAEYVGQTAPKTNDVIDQAIDGILYLDEAYQLADSERGWFGQEALDTALTRMENDRGRLMVILSGYQEAMRKFLEMNPGFLSKFAGDHFLVFPDYKPDELFVILKRMCDARKLVLSPEMEQMLSEVLENLYNQRDEDSFDNAREMQNLLEELEVNWADRIFREKLPIDEPIRPEDLPQGYKRYQRPGSPRFSPFSKNWTT